LHELDPAREDLHPNVRAIVTGRYYPERGVRCEEESDPPTPK